MAVKSGMSVQQTQETLAAYFEDLLGNGPYARHFADEVALSVMWSDQVAHGPAEAKRLIDLLHKEAFAASPILRMLCVGEGQALLEAEFVARHIGEFAGRAPTGKEVRIPYSVAYDLADGKITALRLYFSLDQLLRELDAA